MSELVLVVGTFLRNGEIGPDLAAAVLVGMDDLGPTVFSCALPALLTALQRSISVP